MRDIGKIKRRKVGDRRRITLHADRNRIIARFRFVSGWLTRCFCIFAGAFTGLQRDAIVGAGQPLLHRCLHFSRRQRREYFQLLFIKSGVASQNLSMGQGNRLAPETADLFETANGRGDGIGRSSADLILGRAFGDEFFDDLVHPLFNQGDIGTRLYGCANAQNTDPLKGIIAGRNTDCDFFVANQRVIQPATGKAAQNICTHAKRSQRSVADAGRRPVVRYIGGSDLILHHRPQRLLQLRDRCSCRYIHRAAGDLTEIFLDQRPRLGHRNVARQYQRRIIGAIFVAKPVAHIIHRGGIKISHRTDYSVVIGMAFRKYIFQNFIEDQAAGLVVPLPFFILDDAALVIQFLLGDRTEQIAHPVTLDEQRPLECATRHRLKIVGAIEIGRAVIIGRAHFLQIFEIVPRCILRSVEHQMFEQMRETGLSLGLVLGTDIIPHRHADNRCLAIGVHQNLQAVVQGEFVIRNSNRSDQVRNRCRLGRFMMLCQRGSCDGQGSRGQRQEQGARQTGHGGFPLDQDTRFIG